MKDTLNTYSFTLEDWNGETEEIKLRLPTLKKIPEYLDKQGDEVALLVFLSNIGKDEDQFVEEEFFDQFTDDSIYKVADEVGVLMDPRLAAWTTRQAAKLEKIRAQRRALGLDLSPKFTTNSPPKSQSSQVGNLTGSPS